MFAQHKTIQSIRGVIEASVMHPNGKKLYRIMDMWFLAEDLIVR